MNWRAVWSIYRKEMARTFRTIWQSLVLPVLSTSLDFVVFCRNRLAHRGGRRRRIRGLSSSQG